MTSKQSIDNDINAMLAARAEAFAVKDAQAAMRHSTDDAVHFLLAPPLMVTGNEPDELQEWFDTWDGPIGGDVCNERLTAGEDVAFWSGLVRMTGTKIDGAKVDLWFRTTLGLVRTASGRKVAHEHESVPFAMDGSGLGLFDLTP
jgi:ketosteroid isomerase-like protein